VSWSAHYCGMRSSVTGMDSTQLLKGVLDLAVLAVVDDEDGYGYDIVRR
jgi:PadR family transcriptional regulator PadR